MYIYHILFVAWISAVGSVYLYRGAFFAWDSPGSYLWMAIFGFGFGMFGSVGNSKTYTEVVPVPEVEPSSNRFDFAETETVWVFRLAGAAIAVLGLILRFWPNLHLLVKPRAPELHLLFLLGLGAVVASIRTGAILDLQARRAQRWISLLGLKLSSSMDLEADIRVELRRVFLPFRGKNHRSVNEFNRLVLCQSGRDWTFFFKAKPKEAGLIASLLGRSEFRHCVIDRSEGLAQKLKSDYFLNEGTDQDSKQTVRSRRTPLKLLLLAFMVTPILALFLPMFVRPRTVPERPRVKQTHIPPRYSTEQQVASKDLQEAGRRYDHFKKGAEPDAKEMEAILALLDRGLKQTPKVAYGYNYRAHIRLALDPKADIQEDVNEYIRQGGLDLSIAWKLKENSRLEEALVVAETLRTRPRNCGAKILYGILLFELGREREASTLSYGLVRCKKYKGYKTYEKLLKEWEIRDSRERHAARKKKKKK